MPVFVKEERSTSFVSGSDTNAWNVALEHINIGNLDAAYSRILKDGDTLQLVRLVEQTGLFFSRFTINLKDLVWIDFNQRLRLNYLCDLSFFLRQVAF